MSRSSNSDYCSSAICSSTSVTPLYIGVMSGGNDLVSFQVGMTLLRRVLLVHCRREEVLDSHLDFLIALRRSATDHDHILAYDDDSRTATAEQYPQTPKLEFDRAAYNTNSTDGSVLYIFWHDRSA